MTPNLSMLSHYVSVGVEELDQDKLTPLLRLKCDNSIADALADLGRAEDIRRVFADFQRYLYQEQAARMRSKNTNRANKALHATAR